MNLNALVLKCSVVVFWKGCVKKGGNLLQQSGNAFPCSTVF